MFINGDPQREILDKMQFFITFQNFDFTIPSEIKNFKTPLKMSLTGGWVHTLNRIAPSVVI
jgi:hypothetical protein